VYNKHTGVVEREDNVWPSAVQAAKYFNEEVLAFEEKSEEEGTIADVIPLATH
jgi:hypothetical protein